MKPRKRYNPVREFNRSALWTWCGAGLAGLSYAVAVTGWPARWVGGVLLLAALGVVAHFSYVGGQASAFLAPWAEDGRER